MDLILFSSGIDSILAQWVLKKQDIECMLVYYATRSRCCIAEIKNLENRRVPIIIDVSLTLADIEDKNAYVPNRNLLMALHASGKYKPESIFIGGTKSDRVPDNNEAIMKQVAELATASLGRDVNITSPFWNKYKIEVAKEYVADAEGNADNLVSSFSCYSPIEDKDTETWEECMRCSACFRKSVILHGAAHHSRLFKTPHIINKYAKEFSDLSKEEQTARSIATMEYIAWLRGPKQIK